MPEQTARTYIAIDLKSFFASVECVERGLDPLSTNLVVADLSRTEKTICLAVTPSLKAHGISGRARLFEVVQRVREVNRQRNLRQWELHAAQGGAAVARPSSGPRSGWLLTGKSADDKLLQAHPEYAVDYIVAPPRMKYYIDYSTRVYSVYLKYVAPEDIHAYSIDEVFMDVTDYLYAYKMSAEELAMTIIKDVLKTTGITATAGIGTNLYLAKIAMDIVAKHIPADENGVRMAALDEMTYRRKLWNHRPITDFWRVGKGIARRLEKEYIYTMGDIARQSVRNEGLLYKLFGVNAELLIDHAWGWEPCRLCDIKAYRPERRSLSSGQVLQSPYTFSKARVVVQEMAEGAALDLLDKHLLTDQIVLDVGYDIESLKDENIRSLYHGETQTDHYGRVVPKSAHGSANLGAPVSSSSLIKQAVANLFDRIANPVLLVRRLTLTTNNVVPEQELEQRRKAPRQLNLFEDGIGAQEEKAQQENLLERERKVQQAVLNIKKLFGKNAILKGVNFDEGATAIERNSQIGGHKA